MEESPGTPSTVAGPVNDEVIDVMDAEDIADAEPIPTPDTLRRVQRAPDSSDPVPIPKRTNPIVQLQSGSNGAGGLLVASPGRGIVGPATPIESVLKARRAAAEATLSHSDESPKRSESILSEDSSEMFNGVPPALCKHGEVEESGCRYCLSSAAEAAAAEAAAIYSAENDAPEVETELRPRGWRDKEFRRQFLAAAIGNILEWYDFAIFGYFASEIGGQFFPRNSDGNSTDALMNSEEEEFTDDAQLLDSFIVFGAAFLMRPLGGVMFGSIGDRFGRKVALELSIVLMLVPSFLMGFVPSYSEIGYAASALLVIVRLCQGLACGGELVGAFIYIIESAPFESRGFWGAACLASSIFGTALGATIGVALRYICEGRTVDTLYGQGAMIDILGWRIAFWISLIFGMIGVHLRRTLGESKEFEEPAVKRTAIQALKDVFREHWRGVMLTVGNTALWTTLFWLSFVWLASFSEGVTQSHDDFLEEDDERDPFLVSLGSQLFCIVLFPFVGLIADQLGMDFVSAVGASLITVGIIPIFILISDGSWFQYTIGQLLCAVLLALIGAPLPLWMARQFPVKHRYTGMGISYNLAQAIFGGPAAAVATALSKVEVIKGYGTTPGLTPALYIMGVALMSIGLKIYGWWSSRKNSEYEFMREPLLKGSSSSKQTYGNALEG